MTRAELAAEIKSLRNEVRLLLLGVAVVLKFDVPTEVTAPVVAALVAKAAWAAGSARFSS